MKDGCEDLLFDDWHLIGRSNDRRLDEIAGAVCQHLAAVNELAALALDLREPLLVIIDRVSRNHRAHQGLLVERVADDDSSIRGHELFQKAWRDAPLQDQPARGRAALARG